MQIVIDRDKEISKLKKMLENLTDEKDIQSVKFAINILEDIGTPLPKVAKWVAQNIHNCHTDFKCSACGYIHNFAHLYGEPTADYPYCPNCGARMEVEE